ncbi:MAG TPA: cytochrome P450 [Pyrinomonadaceae bacterium]|jgi:cytochrome P450
MPEMLLPPGPKINPLDGYLLATGRRDPLSFLLNASQEYGDIVHFRIGGQSIYLLNHPDYVRDVLVNNYKNFLKGRGIDRTNRLIGRGLVTSEGNAHRRQRKLINPLFHRERIAAYGDVMAEYAARVTERWEDGQTLEVTEEMKRITVSIVGKTLFDRDTEEVSGEINAAVQTAIKGFKTFYLPTGKILERILIPQNRRVEKARATLEGFINRLIAERRQSGEDRGDLISMLLIAQEEDAEGWMTDVQIRDEALTIFLTGYEGSAQALTWTWYLLSQHPEVEVRLHAELDAVLGGRLPTTGDMPRLTYTEKVFREAMRLYPPAWRMMRRAIDDHHAGGYTIRAGSLVLLSPYVMHRHERYYAEPTRFNPERWTDDARRSMPEFCYFPFGGGPRRCIGEGFAWMEGMLILATVARHWRLRLAPRHPVSAQPVIMLRSKYGMRMIAERREITAEP